MDRGHKDENLTLIDELLALQKKFMQNAGKVSLNQQSNGGMRTLTFVVQIPDTVPKPPIKPKKRKSPSQKKRELERKKAWIERRNSPSENQAVHSEQKQASCSVPPPTKKPPSSTKMDTHEDSTLGVHNNLFVEDKAPSQKKRDMERKKAWIERRNSPSENQAVNSVQKQYYSSVPPSTNEASSLTKMGTQEEITLGVNSKDCAGDNFSSLTRAETIRKDLEKWSDTTITPTLEKVLDKSGEVLVAKLMEGLKKLENK